MAGRILIFLGFFALAPAVAVASMLPLGIPDNGRLDFTVTRDGDVHFVRVVRGDFDLIDTGELWKIGWRDILPIFAAITRYVQQTIVTTCPDLALLVW